MVSESRELYAPQRALVRSAKAIVPEGLKRGVWMLRACLVAVTFLIGGCSATVKHQIVADDVHEKGVRYYDSAPYLIVYSDGMGGLKWQIRYLPDQSRLMAANPTIDGARTEMTLYFQNGVLSSASTAGDTTELPKALIGAVQSALPFLEGAKVTALDGTETKPLGFPAPYLYKLIIRNDTVEFIGEQGHTKIQVPLKLGQP